MHCGDNYPKEPPVIHFVSQINLPGVNNTNGLIDPKAIPILRDWVRIAAELSKNPRPKEDPLSLEAALISIRKCVFDRPYWVFPFPRLCMARYLADACCPQVHGRTQEAAAAPGGLKVCHLRELEIDRPYTSALAGRKAARFVSARATQPMSEEQRLDVIKWRECSFYGMLTCFIYSDKCPSI